MVTIRYHGNYVGPGWSAGRYGKSKVSRSVPAVDEFDATAKRHDAVYARNGNLKKADYVFYKQNIGRGLKRSVAALAVGAQGYFRAKGGGVPGKLFSSKNSMVLPTPPPSNRKRKRDYIDTVRTRNGRLRLGSQPRRILRRIKKVQKKALAQAKTVGAAGTRVSKLSKVTKKNNFGLPKKFLHGVSVVMENVGKITSTDALYIGHNTMPMETTVRTLGQAMLKFIMKNFHIDVNYAAEILGNSATGHGMIDGDRVLFWYAADEDPSSGMTNITFTYKFSSPNPALSEFNSLETFGQAFEKWLDAGTWTSQFQAQFLEVIPAPHAVTVPTGISWQRWDLKTAKFAIRAVSNLKFQNRTVGSDDNVEADDVDNTPLVGRSYEGNGTGTDVKGQALLAKTPLVAHHRYGTIACIGSDGIDNTEPSVPQRYQDVKKSGYCAVGSGEIKLSTIKTDMTSYFSTLIRKYSGTSLPEDLPLYPKLSTGKFRFFALEKQLNFTEAAQSLRIAYEVNTQLQAVFIPGTQKFGTSNYQIKTSWIVAP